MAKTRTDVIDKLTEVQAKTYPATIAGKIESIEDHAELLGIETSYLGLTGDDPKLAVSTEAVAGIVNKGTINEEVTEGETYTLTAGYYEGGTVTGIAGGGHYELQAKSTTPTESEQTIVGDSNKFLTTVTVEAIDKPTYLTSWTSDGDAETDDILTGKHAYVDGVKLTGTMTDNSAWDAADHILTTGGSTGTSSIQVPEGYHDGTGTIDIIAENKTATAPAPGVGSQTITPSSGYVLNQVIVPALDSKYQDVSAVTAVASHVCEGYKFVNAAGTVVDGALADAGAKQNLNFYNDLLASGADGITVLSGTEAHYTAVEATIDGSLYERLNNI